jgi:elongation factor G
VEQGVDEGLHAGVLKGFTVRDLRVEFLELRRRDGASSPAGYHMAAAQALKSALERAAPVLLEPIMYLEVSVPDAFLGPALNLLNMRGGRVTAMQDKGGGKNLKALAPMRELFGFSTELRSATQGRAGVLMRFERFDSI